MKAKALLILMIFNISTLFGQETFPLNGVKDNFNPIYAFTNANIFITPEKKNKKWNPHSSRWQGNCCRY